MPSWRGGSSIEWRDNVIVVVEKKKVRDEHAQLPLKSVQTGSGAHAASYFIGAEPVFPGCEYDRSPPSDAEVNNE